MDEIRVNSLHFSWRSHHLLNAPSCVVLHGTSELSILAIICSIVALGMSYMLNSSVLGSVSKILEHATLVEMESQCRQIFGLRLRTHGEF